MFVLTICVPTVSSQFFFFVLTICVPARTLRLGDATGEIRYYQSMFPL
jgi:hypothetical protein